MSPLLAVWSSRDLEAAWSLLLEVCGLRWAAALLELETRRQHSWRHLGPAGDGGWLIALPWFTHLRPLLFTLQQRSVAEGIGKGKARALQPR